MWILITVHHELIEIARTLSELVAMAPRRLLKLTDDTFLDFDLEPAQIISFVNSTYSHILIW